MCIATIPLTTACGTAGDPCSSPDASLCHAHIDAQVTVSGSLAVDGDVQRDLSEGTLCGALITAATLWTVPLPATPTAVDGHFFFAQGEILAADNTGPGTYAATAVMGFQVDVDDNPPFVPGGGSVSLSGDGSGSMSLVGFSNGSAQINVVAHWTCTDVRNS